MPARNDAPTACKFDEDFMPRSVNRELYTSSTSRGLNLLDAGECYARRRGAIINRADEVKGRCDIYFFNPFSNNKTN